MAGGKKVERGSRGGAQHRKKNKVGPQEDREHSPPVMADSELVRVCTNVSVPVCRWGWELELQTKVREDFTITEKAP